ncbi:MAG: hypothetical protein NZV14_18010 [Bryobacteraceae bacterium]|nr:hypothetical protein [Bryobacteraceae bacterium]MDW8380060.1 hypothetical protein [Bryobacterales bacterium]
MQVLGATHRVSSLAEHPQTLEQAAQHFEALFLEQLLRMVRESGGEPMGEASDAGGSTLMEVAEQYLAVEIAKGGGLGLAGRICEQLGRDRTAADSPTG